MIDADSSLLRLKKNTPLQPQKSVRYTTYAPINRFSQAFSNAPRGIHTKRQEDGQTACLRFWKLNL